MSIKKWLKNNTSSLKGKLVAITGATGGIGGEVCLILASLGADLILIDRNLERSAARRDVIISKCPETEVHLVTADLENMESVKGAYERLKLMPIDYLILNAGAYSIPRKICSTGYDNVFQINFVSQYYLARVLSPVLSSRGGKIVAVGSIAHNYSKTDENDIDFSTRKKSNLVYGNSKRYLMFSLFALSDVPVSVVHPGITFTNITAHYPKLLFAVIKHPMKVIFMSRRKACLSVIKGVFSECGNCEWIGPWMFDVWGYPKIRKLSTCSEKEHDFIISQAENIFNKISH